MDREWKISREWMLEGDGSGDKGFRRQWFRRQAFKEEGVFTFRTFNSSAFGGACLSDSSL